MSWVGQRFGLGCMRLSTTPERHPERGVAVLHAALDAGVRFLDTADAYAIDQADVGHNERLVAEALRTWSGDRSDVIVSTKGGIRRPGGRWVPDGSAKHLRAACAASLRALDVSRIALYLLHTPDPRGPLKRSIVALAQLQQEGLVERVGVCNVDRHRLEQARAWADISAVSVALSPLDDEALYGGVVAYCEQHQIPLIAHSPLGGPKRHAQLNRHPTLCAVAARHQTTPSQVALTWLREVSPTVVAIPGATRVQTARTCGHDIVFTEDDRNELDEHFRGGVWHRTGRHRPPSSPVRVTVLMGIQGAGKSSATEPLTNRGYQRLNRDDRGGTLAELNAALDDELSTGKDSRWVLDNTYPTRASRARVLDVAWRHDVAVDCCWLNTPLPEAQINAVRRIVARYGKLPEPTELTRSSKRDPHAFDPRAQFRFERDLEPPTVDEGFAHVTTLPFERRHAGERSAVLVQLEGVLRSSRRGDRAPLTPGDVVVDRSRADLLRAPAAQGVQLLGISWQPALAAGETSNEQVAEVMAHTLALLDLSMDVRHCGHAAGPPKCWCRPPQPGLAVQLIDAHRVDPRRTTMVGRSAADKTLATRMGFTYVDHRRYFGNNELD